VKIAVAVLGAVVLNAAPPADAARLRSVTSLKASAKSDSVRLSWKDRATGETRYEVRRSGLSVRVARNRTSYTDRKAKPGKGYRYSVRPCRGKRCATARTVRFTLRGAKKPGTEPPAPTPTPPGDAFAASPVIGGCPIFPKANTWNTDVSSAPVDTAHDYIGALGSMVLWPDFGGAGEYGIPFVSVAFEQPLVAISFEVADESDPGPYPVPPDAPVEGGGDRHVLTLRQGDCRLFELYAAERSGSGWSAYSGAVWDLKTNALRPERWTSADAAGLPILPGLARYEEVAAGAINHALRITVPTTQKAYIHPATHWASSNTDADQPPMGLRLRLKAGYDISGLRGQAKVVAQALKTYGALVADNAGSPRVYVSGANDLRWNDDDLAGIKSIPASALEAVQTNPVVRPY
jgi:hypothetical protein